MFPVRKQLSLDSLERCQGTTLETDKGEEVKNVSSLSCTNQTSGQPNNWWKEVSPYKVCQLINEETVALEYYLQPLKK